MSATPLEPIIKAVAGVVREHVQKAFDALNGRLKEMSGDIEVLKLEVSTRPEKGEDGKSVTAEDVLPQIEAVVVERAMEVLASIETPKPGKDGSSVTLDDVRPLIESKQSEWALDFERRAQDLLQRAIDRIPAPREVKDGVDSDPDEVAAKVIAKLDLTGTRADISKMCRKMVSAAVAEIPLPRDGENAPPVTDEQIADAVAKHIAAHPPRDGADGKDGSSFLGGLGPPKGEGKSGDVYLDTQTGDVYRFC